MSGKLISRIVFILSVLSGAFLLFILEPLTGKLLTPGFGGTSGVWSTCLMFFQIALLGGYLIAYAISSLSARKQSLIWGALVAVSVISAGLPDRKVFVCHDFQNPSPELLGLLLVYTGLPLVVLSSISVMLQSWYRKAGHGDPYPLYSVSNLGSVLALFAFPFLIERHLTVSKTCQIWTWIYCLLAILLLYLSSVIFRSDESTAEPEEQEVPVSASLIAWWCGLSALGSATLVSFTTHITQDVSPVPLLWIMPLGVYLLSFIILFSHPGAYKRIPFAYLFASLAIAEPFISRQFFVEDFIIPVATTLALLFVTCMILHGEIVMSRPAPRRLPLFYLSIATGGALGGIFVNFVAPAIFSMYWESNFLLATIAVLIIVLVAKGKYRISGTWSTAANDVILATFCLLSIVIDAVPVVYINRDLIESQRNFYSSIQITRESRNGKPTVEMVHGRVVHGVEYTGGGIASREPGIYWEPVALSYRLVQDRLGGRPLRAGIVGLGAGFSAALAGPGDLIEYFELDPKVRDLAEKHFSYLKQTRAKVKVSIGDGRIALSNLSPRSYDLLLIDAFNGDAIPVHLLTREAMDLYLEHLDANGLLVFNVTNRHVNIVPVLANVAASFNLEGRVVQAETAVYMLLSRSPDYFEKLPLIIEADRTMKRVSIKPVRSDPRRRTWTDDYIDIVPYIL
ncbi:MAG: spermidine synthase [Candidatus Obscuribacterales bacterium]